MIEPFDDVVRELEDTFRKLEAQVPPPQVVEKGDGIALRYVEKTVQQAALMKFGRYISGLHAINVLLGSGLCQEMGVIQRTLDDIEEDLLFLSFGLQPGNWTDRHDQYLEYFWTEEPGAGMVKRDKIRAFVNQASGIEDPSSGIEVSKTLFKAYSGFVHAGAVAVSDMCAGDPPRFHLSGMKETPFFADHIEDAWNPLYRGLVSACVVAAIFGNEALRQERFEAMKAFEQQFAAKIVPVGA